MLTRLILKNPSHTPSNTRTLSGVCLWRCCYGSVSVCFPLRFWSRYHGLCGRLSSFLPLCPFLSLFPCLGLALPRLNVSQHLPLLLPCSLPLCHGLLLSPSILVVFCPLHPGVPSSSSLAPFCAQHAPELAVSPGKKEAKTYVSKGCKMRVCV